MRIRLSFVIDIKRSSRPDPEPDETLEFAGAHVERAGWQPIGFQIQPTENG